MAETIEKKKELHPDAILTPREKRLVEESYAHPERSISAAELRKKLGW